MVLSLLPDRSTERERERGKGGRRVTEGVRCKKEGCSAQKHKVLGLETTGRSDCLGFFLGGGLQALHISVFRFKPHRNPANMIHQNHTRLKRLWGDSFCKRLKSGLKESKVHTFSYPTTRINKTFKWPPACYFPSQRQTAASISQSVCLLGWETWETPSSCTPSLKGHPGMLTMS